LTGKDVHFLIRGESSTLLYRDLVKDTIKEGRIEGEFNLRRKDKRSFPGYLSSSIIREGKRVRGIVIVVADLTRLYEVETRLKQSEKLASLGKVVEGIAHEVRNCLTSLGGFAFRLRKITADIPDCDDFTRIILGDVARLETMVREIEEYVKFSKFYTFQFRKVQVPELIDRAHARVRSEIPEELYRHVSFSIRSEKHVPPISADPAALEEIFFNLMLNAYEAMPSGGKLKIAVRNRASAVSVAIADTGTGMKKNDVSDIFNPFVTTKTSGAGMGLSKVYLLVEEHRGSVRVTSELGKGSTFEVFLPLERLMTGLRSWESAAGGRPA
jgi:signal transduction histidine kinase